MVNPPLVIVLAMGVGFVIGLVVGYVVGDLTRGLKPHKHAWEANAPGDKYVEICVKCGKTRASGWN